MTTVLIAGLENVIIVMRRVQEQDRVRFARMTIQKFKE